MEINSIMPSVGSTMNKGVGLKDSVISAKDSDFKKLLNSFTADANITDYEDKQSNISLMLGEDINTHDAMIAAEKADLTLRLAIQIRNKIIDAYIEVMRMQI